jgi:hypothetical protein
MLCGGIIQVSYIPVRLIWKDRWDTFKWIRKKAQNHVYILRTDSHTNNNEKQLLVGEGTGVDGGWGENDS